MLLMIDNFDSFTFNLVHYFEEIGQTVLVKRNNDININEIKNLSPEYIVISPGPCTPDESGVSLDVIKQFAGDIPILGVCLGHQSIAQVFGATVCRAKAPMHGKTSKIQHNDQGAFSGLTNPLTVARYHSLVVDESTLPEGFEVTAWTTDEQGDKDEIMGIRHQALMLEGIQFHPEAILTEQGHELLNNFIEAFKR